MWREENFGERYASRGLGGWSSKQAEKRYGRMRALPDSATAAQINAIANCDYVADGIDCDNCHQERPMVVVFEDVPYYDGCGELVSLCYKVCKECLAKALASLNAEE